MDAERDLAECSRRYREHGCAFLPRLIAPERGDALAAGLMRSLRDPDISARHDDSSALINVKAVGIYGVDHPAMDAFQAELTPAIAAIAGCALLPTYSYFRIYPQGAVCRVHGDRPACEHSVSLMLVPASRVPWPLEVAATDSEPGDTASSEDFGGADHFSLPMAAGDAVLYRGITRRHGRITPNPNRWSAHLFLHWVDRDGPYAGHAFDLRSRA